MARRMERDNLCTGCNSPIPYYVTICPDCRERAENQTKHVPCHKCGASVIVSASHASNPQTCNACLDKRIARKKAR